MGALEAPCRSFQCPQTRMLRLLVQVAQAMLPSLPAAVRCHSLELHNVCQPLPLWLPVKAAVRLLGWVASALLSLSHLHLHVELLLVVQTQVDPLLLPPHPHATSHAQDAQRY